MLEETKSLIMAPWDRRTRQNLGTRPPKLQASFEMKPETPVSD
jgi:hypothetical protein